MKKIAMILLFVNLLQSCDKNDIKIENTENYVFKNMDAKSVEIRKALDSKGSITKKSRYVAGNGGGASYYLSPNGYHFNSGTNPYLSGGVNNYFDHSVSFHVQGQFSLNNVYISNGIHLDYHNGSSFGFTVPAYTNVNISMNCTFSSSSQVEGWVTIQPTGQHSLSPNYSDDSVYFIK